MEDKTFLDRLESINEQLNLTHYWIILLKYKRILFITPILIGVLGYLIALNINPIFKSYATLVIEEAGKNIGEAAKKTANKEKTANKGKEKPFASSGVKQTIESGPSKKKDVPRANVRAEYDWAMEEAAAWNKEHMRFDELKHKNKFQTFRYASEPDTYPVPDYFEYLPSHVKNAEMKYKQKVFDKHIGKYEKLKY